MKLRIWMGVFTFVAALPASSQSAPVDLQGKVIDTSGAVVSHAIVDIVDTDGHHLHLTTNAAGRFNFESSPGLYETTVTSPGFQLRQGPMTYAGNATAIVTLAVGAITTDTEIPPSSTVPANRAPLTYSGGATWEYGALFQGGVGITDHRNSFRFLMAGAHLGKVLTPELGTGALRGNFEYAAELFPYWQSFTPTYQRANCYAQPTTGATLVSPGVYCSALFRSGGTYSGVSVTPIILRWNFTRGQRFMPFVQGAGGLIWTNHKYPGFGSNQLNLANDGPGTDTSVWNFTPQFGVGAHYFVKPRRSIDFGANAIHISSASLGDKNPGVNASVQFSLGYTWWK